MLTFTKRKADGGVAFRVLEVEIRQQGNVVLICCRSIILLHQSLVFQHSLDCTFVIIQHSQMEWRLSEK